MSHRRKLALAAALLCPLALTGCVDNVPDAQQARAPSDGVEADVGQIRVLNAMLIAPEDAGAGVVNLTLVNRGSEPDRLGSIEVLRGARPSGLGESAGTVELAAPHELPGNAMVTFGVTPGPTATVRDLTVKPGEAVTLKLTFENAGPVALPTVVVPATGEYATITPSPEPTPPATPEATMSPPESVPADSASPAAS